MRFPSIAALAALAVGVSGQTTVPQSVQQSVLMVLATALPQESIQYALSSQSAFASAIASSLSAGNTPAWYQALPTDVKSLLPIIYKVDATATPSATATPTATPAMTSAHSPSVSSSAAASSSHISIASTSLSPSSSKSAGATGAAATGAASLPSAAIGAGVGAALGFIGMLAL